jgi:hypothetical protein
MVTAMINDIPAMQVTRAEIIAALNSSGRILHQQISPVLNWFFTSTSSRTD